MLSKSIVEAQTRSASFNCFITDTAIIVASTGQHLHHQTQGHHKCADLHSVKKLIFKA